jgi:hypothetical protein
MFFSQNRFKAVILVLNIMYSMMQGLHWGNTKKNHSPWQAFIAEPKHQIS